MNIRKLSILLAAIFAFSTVLFAQQQQQQTEVAPFVPKAEVFAGYSFIHSGLQNFDPLNTGNLNGLTMQLTVYPLRTNFGITADVTRTTATDVEQQGVDVTRYTYLLGPTYALRNTSSFTPFVHVLFGEDHERFDISQQNDYYTNAFAESFGGGLDGRLSSHVALRVAQFDYIHTSHTNGENHFRYSAGLVLGF